MGKRIAIGCDHGGFGLKERLVKYLSKKGYSLKDFGSYTKNPYDYPLVGFKVAKAVSTGAFRRAILICKSGIGMAIVANKLPGVRSAVCNTVGQAKSSRQHNDTNVLSLAAEYIDFAEAKKITDIWLNTGSLGGRHKRRVKQIKRLEKR
ncbi:MAG: ribose 5-phosphate isomerase B [Omnitrophica bacterium]|nr:ribose 5-phosphate isomerase B [Candidatus Omnitrophota bacterium]